MSPPKKHHIQKSGNQENLVKRISTGGNGNFLQQISRGLQKSKTLKIPDPYTLPPELELVNQTLPNNETDLDMIIDEFELRISKLKQENQSFFEYVDDLNDATFANEQENKRLTTQIKQLDKQIVDLNKEMINVKKNFDKSFPELKDKIIYSDVNIDSLLKTHENSLNEDIISYMSKK